MLNACKIFRFIGILPYKIAKNQIVYCLKWHYYSYIIAALISSLTVGYGLMYTQYTVDSRDSNYIYQLLLKWEPTLIFVNILVIYYTIFKKKRTKRAIKMVRQLLEIKSAHFPEQKILWWTSGSLVILLIVAVVCYVTTIQYYHGNEFQDFFDCFTDFIFTALEIIQIIQLCLYFEVINGAFSELKTIIADIDDDVLCPTSILIEIKKLRKLKSNVEQFYYPNIICQELSCLIYCIMGFRGGYDFISQNYTSSIIALTNVIWVSYEIPFQFYLMHLSHGTEEKVSLHHLIYQRLFRRGDGGGALFDYAFLFFFPKSHQLPLHIKILHI